MRTLVIYSLPNGKISNQTVMTETKKEFLSSLRANKCEVLAEVNSDQIQNDFLLKNMEENVVGKAISDLVVLHVGTTIGNVMEDMEKKIKDLETRLNNLADRLIELEEEKEES